VIGYYESCSKNPTIETLQRFADFFGVPVSQLIEDAESAQRKRGSTSRIEKQVERIKRLSPVKQRTIANMIEAFLTTD